MFSIPFLPLEFQSQMNTLLTVNEITCDIKIPVNRLMVMCSKNFFVNKHKVVWCVFNSELSACEELCEDLEYLIPILKWSDPFSYEITKPVAFLAREICTTSYLMKDFLSQLELYNLITKEGKIRKITSNLAKPFLIRKKLKHNIIELPRFDNTPNFNYTNNPINTFSKFISNENYSFLELKILFCLLSELDFYSYKYLDIPSIQKHFNLSEEELYEIFNKFIKQKLLVYYNDCFFSLNSPEIEIK